VALCSGFDELVELLVGGGKAGGEGALSDWTPGPGTKYGTRIGMTIVLGEGDGGAGYRPAGTGEKGTGWATADVSPPAATEGLVGLAAAAASATW